MSRRNELVEGKVYIGGLPNDARNDEVEDAFRKYGKIRKVWLAKKPPGFGFVEFEEVRDAEDAVRSLDGTKICGMRVKVELCHGKSRNPRSGGGGGGDYGRGGGGGRGGGFNDRERRRSRSPRGSGGRQFRRNSPRKEEPERRPRSFSRSRSPQ